ESYETLSRVNAADMLESYAPDLILCDEAQALRNPKAACTRRITRYLAKHSDTKMALLSGTITRRGLIDYWHLAGWALGEEQMPLPNNWSEMTEWGEAVDRMKGGN